MSTCYLEYVSNTGPSNIYFQFPKHYRIYFQDLSLEEFIFMSVINLLFSSHSVVSDSATPWTAACQVSLSFTISQSLLKFTSIELMMPSNYLILHHLLLFLPSIFPSIRVFSNESILLIGWPKFWGFSFNISPSSEYSGLVSFINNWGLFTYVSLNGFFFPKG